MIAKLLRGEPTTAILTAPAAVVPGQLVAFGHSVFIAVNRAASGAKASFAIGGGVYLMTASEVSGDEPTVGSPCYLDSDLIVDDTQGGKHVGVALVLDGDEVEVYHQPNGSTLTP